MLPQKGGLVTKWWQRSSGWVWDGHPTWAGLEELCSEQPAPARGLVSSDLFAFRLQDVSGRAGAVHCPRLENFPASSYPW